MTNAKTFSRRRFIGSAAAAAAALSMGPAAISSHTARPSMKNQAFKLKYAPYLRMFINSAGEDPIDQLKFIADQGFEAIFDNGLMRRPIEVQEAIAKEMDRLGLVMGPFVAYAEKEEAFVKKDESVRHMLADKMKAAVEVAQRTNSKWALVVPGNYDQRLEWDYQTANVIENLRMCAEVCEQSGLVLVLEPLNSKRDQPGRFLTTMPQSYMICRAVDSPSCKIVNDLYHQQITEGNLIENIDKAWDEIASFHLADSPGHKEPTTGEINYKNIFKFIYKKGYSGVICMEHQKSLEGKEGEQKVIEVYRTLDDFDVAE
jgi:hydroxypyruvate isomerase